MLQHVEIVKDTVKVAVKGKSLTAGVMIREEGRKKK